MIEPGTAQDLEEVSPRCPQCGSTNQSIKGLPRFTYQCRICKRIWLDALPVKPLEFPDDEIPF